MACCNLLDFVVYPSNGFILHCSRAVGYRFGPYLQDTVPLLINYCKTASENDEELREYSLQVYILIFQLVHMTLVLHALFRN